MAESILLFQTLQEAIQEEEIMYRYYLHSSIEIFTASKEGAWSLPFVIVISQPGNPKNEGTAK